MVLASTIAISVGVPVIVYTAYNLTKGIFVGCFMNNADAQLLINNDNDENYYFVLGVSAANMAKYGTRSLQFEQ
jgi:hypothetical protein